ncbi:MAG: CPBP family intramembrane metalloprotease [Acidobacteria bacterium]|nr:CPBP family intramembrane metalloprotease [Acidobacteriota bacterium]MBV9147154.1 CPBP family intramembrane metalloprotease [Acidobacteriota bacterium]
MPLTPEPPFNPLPEPGAEPPLPVQQSRSEALPWGVLDVILIAIFSLIATGLLTIISFAVVHAVPKWKHYTVGQLAAEPLAVVIPQALGYLLTLFFMMLVVRRSTDAPFWEAVRWRWPGNMYLYVAGGIVLSLAIQIGSSFLPIPKSLPIDEFFKTTHAAWVLAIFGVLFAPLFEELFFRGFLYPALYERIGFVAAAILNSLIFAFTHEGQLAHAWAPLLVLFVVGMTLTYVRERTGSVAKSFLVHAGYNAFLFGMIFVATNGFRHMEKLK